MGPASYEERQFIVTVDGDFTNPALETDKVSDTLWVDRANVEKLKQRMMAILLKRRICACKPIMEH